MVTTTTKIVNNKPTNTKNKPGLLSLRTIDFMGGSFNLSYSTSTGKYQTLIGGYVTILLGLVVLSCSALIFSQYLNTEAPIVTSTTEFNSNYTDFNLYQEELFPILCLVIGNMVVPGTHAARYFTPKMQIEKTTYNNQTRSYDYKLLHSFSYVPCDQIEDHKILNVLHRLSASAEEMAGSGLCPDFKGSPNEFRALRDLSNSTYRYARLRMYPCSLPDSRQCASPLELAHATIAYTTNDRLLKSSNYEEPVTLSPETRSVNIEISARKRRELELRLNQLEDDTHILKNPSLKAEYVTLHQVGTDFRMRSSSQTTCTEAQIEKGPAGGCQEYAVLVNGPSGKLVKTRRSYRKITTVLGELGGFIKLATTLAFILYSYYNARSVKNYLKQNLYNFGGLLKEKRGSLTKTENKVHQETFGSNRNREQSNMKETPIDKKKYEKVIEQCVETRRSGVEMMKKLDFVEIMQEFFFEKHDKVLLPLIILRLKEKQMKKETKIKINNKKSNLKNINKNDQNPEQTRLRPKRSIFAKKASIEHQPSTGTFKNELIEHDKANEEEMDYEKAFEALKNSNPKTPIKKAIKRFILENVEVFFNSKADRPSEGDLEQPSEIMPQIQQPASKPFIQLEAAMEDFEEIDTPTKSNIPLNNSVDLNNALSINESNSKRPSGFKKFMLKKSKTRQKKEDAAGLAQKVQEKGSRGFRALNRDDEPKRLTKLLMIG